MAAPVDGEDFHELLKSSKKLDRDRGAELLAKTVVDTDDNTLRNIEQFLLNTMTASQTTWETRQGALMAAKVVLEATVSPNDFDVQVKEHVLKLLDDTEYAVRITAGEVLGMICKKNCSALNSGIHTTVLNGIQANLATVVTDHHPLTSSVNRSMTATHFSATSHPIDNLTGAELLDPARWKHLETWMKCLQSIINACSAEFNLHINNSLLDLMSLALNNSNRFVRETTCNLLCAIIATNCTADGELSLQCDHSAVCQHSVVIARLLASGLADSCSQVRMAACIATRKFLVCLPGGATSHPCFLSLLPALCFNRYYMAAEGVRLYSQETWNIATGGQGKQLVETHIDSVVDFYINQLSVNNPEVKDAACACIMELSQKMDRTVLSPHVHRLLAALQASFCDFYFSTRDASCVACGKLIASFPQETKPLMDTVYPCLFDLLQDNTAPVREAAAIAIGSCVSAFGAESLKPVLDRIREGLEGVKKPVIAHSTEAGIGGGCFKLSGESPTTAVQSEKDTRIAESANASSATQHDLSPGTISPSRSHRPPEPWELADGCVCLMCELSRLPFAVNDVAKLVPCLATAMSHRHYPHYVFFLQSVCKQLPVLFKNLGKRFLKMYLDIFLDIIFFAASSDAVPVAESAQECIALLSADLGPNIFRARVENHNPRFLQYLPQCHAAANQNLH